MEEFKPAPIRATATVADLEKLDIRVGTILSVEDVPKSNKLLRLTVDLGDHRRTILAGMKGERANPGEIVGLQALFVVNLEPRRMAGEVSEGMLLDIGFAEVRQRGSHKQYRHADGRGTTVPFHTGRDISPTLLRKIAKDVGLTAEQLLGRP